MQRSWIVTVAVVMACASTNPSSEPAPHYVSCSAAKNGDPCDGSESYCSGQCSSITPVRFAQCNDGHWYVGSYTCEPKPRTDAGVVDPPPPAQNDTVGKPCLDDGQCDPAETGFAFCSSDAFVLGPVYPTNVCFEVECDGEGSPCGSGRGLCMSRMCLPKCTYDATGPTGCLARTSCFAGPKSPGVGYCFGGCRSDEDCAAIGAVCQQEIGWCVKTRVAFTKSLGSACTESDDRKACACRHDATTKLGYCTQVCRVGDACPTGWVCDAGLPEGAPAPPNDLAGWCAKTCTTDGECAALNARCVAGVCRVASPAL